MDFFPKEVLFSILAWLTKEDMQVVTCVSRAFREMSVAAASQNEWSSLQEFLFLSIQRLKQRELFPLQLNNLGAFSSGLAKLEVTHLLMLKTYMLSVKFGLIRALDGLDKATTNELFRGMGRSLFLGDISQLLESQRQLRAILAKENPEEKEDDLMQFCKGLCENKLFDWALVVADTLAEGPRRTHFLADISSHLGQLGHFNKALSVA
ncbi:MAG: hypothetical protein EBZ47_03555, partial [Chlamydiae bacterium]|nr:hypothetical protein [Chlamydiota bacterium]